MTALPQLLAAPEEVACLLDRLVPHGVLLLAGPSLTAEIVRDLRAALSSDAE